MREKQGESGPVETGLTGPAATALYSVIVLVHYLVFVCSLFVSFRLLKIHPRTRAIFTRIARKLV